MDMQSVLEATFPVPAGAPDWQAELLLRLDADSPSKLVAASTPTATAFRPLIVQPRRR
jgi:hypothetical protein